MLEPIISRFESLLRMIPLCTWPSHNLSSGEYWQCFTVSQSWDPKTPHSSNLWVWQVCPELSIGALGFPVVCQQGAEVCVTPPFRGRLLSSVVSAHGTSWTTHNPSGLVLQTPPFCCPAPAVPLAPSRGAPQGGGQR